MAQPTRRRPFNPCGGGNGPCDSLPKVWVCREPALASLTGTSSKVMLVTLLRGQLCQALFSRKARALVCRPSRAANFRKVQF